MQLTLANSLVSGVGSLFHPVFAVIATALAWIYAVIPNYAVAIALLTVLIMALLTPLTVKSTKSMLAMQRLQPEMKKLQQKYKGPENREQLNQELMKLYKQAGVNPASSCVPMFLQMPFFIVLYDTIKGLTNTVTSAAKSACSPALKINGVFSDPRYIPHTSTMFHHLCAAGGNMPAFGLNLALKPTSYHSSVFSALPYYGLVLGACALQFVQMWQMNRRNPGAMQANPQMKTMQYFMPIIFAVIYVNVQSAVVIYMIVSTLARIVTQDVLFRTGVVQMPGQREISSTSNGSNSPAPRGAKSRPGLGERLRDAREALAGGAAANLVDPKSGPGDGGSPGDGDVGDGGTAGSDGSGRKNPAASARPPGKPRNGQPPANGSSRGPASAKGSTGDGRGDSPPDAGATGDSGDDRAGKPQNRSRAKKTRKAR